jgi:hypothetical protein
MVSSVVRTWPPEVRSCTTHRSNCFVLVVSSLPISTQKPSVALEAVLGIVTVWAMVSVTTLP